MSPTQEALKVSLIHTYRSSRRKRVLGFLTSSGGLDREDVWGTKWTMCPHHERDFKVILSSTAQWWRDVAGLKGLSGTWDGGFWYSG